jgi:hypothetical protein
VEERIVVSCLICKNEERKRNQEVIDSIISISYWHYSSCIHSVNIHLRADHKCYLIEKMIYQGYLGLSNERSFVLNELAG